MVRMVIGHLAYDVVIGMTVSVIQSAPTHPMTVAEVTSGHLASHLQGYGEKVIGCWGALTYMVR